MAHKKGVGSSKNGRESASKRLGVKIFGGQACKDNICSSGQACLVKHLKCSSCKKSLRRNGRCR